MHAKIQRRDFMRLAAASGVALGAAGIGRAVADIRSGGLLGAPEPFFVMVQAFGGWDPTMLCDPKPNLQKTFKEVKTAGNIPYAVSSTMADTFFQTHYSRLTVINGVDHATNNHEAGRRNGASGALAPGYPTFAALFAGAVAPGRPMSFLALGRGYTRTSGLVAPTREGSLGALGDLANPDRIDGLPDGPAYLPQAVYDRLLSARDERLADLADRQTLPSYRAATDKVELARSGTDELDRLMIELPETLSDDASLRRAELTIAAAKAEVATSASISTDDNFDTHSDHDNVHSGHMARLLGLIDHLWNEAERQLLADRLVVLVTSDFGRSPGYNGGNGKDHWPISSMMILSTQIEGNRVIGQTNENHEAIPLDPQTLQPAANPDDGFTIDPSHVHRDLRRLAGLEGTEVDNQFALPGNEDITLFA